MEGLVGFEPTIGELQSHALPLGYRPITRKIITKKNIFDNIFYFILRFLYFLLIIFINLSTPIALNIITETCGL